MSTNPSDLSDLLQKYFGFSSFRGNQGEIIKTLLSGKDVFVLMPTGGGKSLCYQFPSLISEGTAVVVSPLIALMKNQVDVMNSLPGGSGEGVAHVLNSSLTRKQAKKVLDDIRSGKTKLLYAAPESLVKQEYSDFLKTTKISFFAIDEAHCISEWGHDFRPEYRNLRAIIEKIAQVPLIALTATATPKVQYDIQKNLGMSDAVVFKESFNRPNLFYEVRPKIDVNREVVKFIRKNEGKSGIVYCSSRRRVEEFTQLLQVNGIEALPYHAGLDAKTRTINQDSFLTEKVNIIVATIAFGMGIDKPDVRFVIHHDIPKSLESYYQETGRAGRDGGEGHCIAFYDPRDIEKLEKLLAQKSVSEREVGLQLLFEMKGYAETNMNRRQYLLHYFGEEFDPIHGQGAKMCDNSISSPDLKRAEDDLRLVLSLVKSLEEKFKEKDFLSVVLGEVNFVVKSCDLDKSVYFGQGKGKSKNYWKTVIRQAVVQGYLKKDVETYGILKLTEKGEVFLKNEGGVFMITEDRIYDLLSDGGGSEHPQESRLIDQALFNQLVSLRKEVAGKHNIPVYTVFQDQSLEDMTIRYPISVEEMTKVYGVGEGKARRFGVFFSDFIRKYVEENAIERPEGMVLKMVADKANHKVFIIQSCDKKIALEDIARAKNLSFGELLSDMESIVYQGTKLDIDYYVEERFDEETLEDFTNFMMESESDSMRVICSEYGDEFSEDELRILRIKFISDVAN